MDYLVSQKEMFTDKYKSKDIQKLEKKRRRSKKLLYAPIMIVPAAGAMRMEGLS